jgi:SAM-dependent methyltransferase
MIHRNAKLLSMVDVARHEGIEICPLDHPVVTRERGKVFYADCDTTERLRAKYASNPDVRVENLVEVDYVLDGWALPEAAGQTRKFDFAIANHVIEQVPDMIGFLNNLTNVVRPGGLICLAILDKRYTFNYFRNTTVLADLVDAHIRQLRRPSIRQVFDHFASAVELPVASAWEGTLHRQHLHKLHSLQEALLMARLVADSDRQVECHCNVFTPASFFELLRGCFDQGLLHVEVAQFWPTAPNDQEFLVILRRISKHLDDETRIRIQTESLPPPELMAHNSAAGWQPRKAPGFLAGSRSKGFDNKIFYVENGMRYWITAVDWAVTAGFRWPEDIRWLSDEEIANYTSVTQPPPPADAVRLRM